MCVSLGFIGFVLAAVGTMGVGARQITWIDDYVDRQILAPRLRTKFSNPATIAVRDVTENDEVVEQGDEGFEQLVEIVRGASPSGAIDLLDPDEVVYRVDVIENRDLHGARTWVRCATDQGIKLASMGHHLRQRKGNMHDAKWRRYQDWSRYPFYSILILGFGLQTVQYLRPEVMWCPLVWLSTLI